MAGVGTCLFCQIARSSTSTPLLYSDDTIVAFQDIKPSAFRHYLVIPVEHISTVKDLQKRTEDYNLVSHMLNVGQSLLHKDAPESKHYRFPNQLAHTNTESDSSWEKHSRLSSLRYLKSNRKPLKRTSPSPTHTLGAKRDDVVFKSSLLQLWTRLFKNKFVSRGIGSPSSSSLGRTTGESSGSGSGSGSRESSLHQ